jgi:hypothetical protein
MMTNIVIPVLIGLLIINTLISCFLQYLGSYENMYRFTSKLKLAIIHPTLVLDYAKEILHNDIQRAVGNFQAQNLKDSCKYKLNELFKYVTKDILNLQNPLTGNTCLLEAYSKGFYDLVKQMEEKGADPKIKNKAGKNVESCEKRNKIKEFTEKKQTWKNEIFYYEVLTDQDKCKVILRDEDKVNGKIYWSLEINDTTDPLKINTFFAFGMKRVNFWKVQMS